LRALRQLLAPVRNRATIAACVVVACFSVAAATLFLALLRQSLVDILDDAVAELAEDVASEVEQDILPPVFVSNDNDNFIQVVADSGRVISRSNNLPEGTPPLGIPPSEGRPAAHTVASLPFGDGGDFRVVALRARSPEGPVTVYAGSTLAVVDDEVVVARSLLAAGLPLLIGLVGTTTWVVVGRSLRPVEAIRRGGRHHCPRPPSPRLRAGHGRRGSPPGRHHERHAGPPGGGHRAPAAFRG
jgi:hypothetical protein